MTSTVIIYSIIGFIVFIGLGYYLWLYALDKYDYNIFNLGVIIRGLLSFVFLFVAFLTSENKDAYLPLFFLIIAVFLWLWTFIITLMRTNIVIAFVGLLYQLFAVILIKYAINKLLED